MEVMTAKMTLKALFPPVDEQCYYVCVTATVETAG